MHEAPGLRPGDFAFFRKEGGEITQKLATTAPL